MYIPSIFLTNRICTVRLFISVLTALMLIFTARQKKRSFPQVFSTYEKLQVKYMKLTQSRNISSDISHSLTVYSVIKTAQYSGGLLIMNLAGLRGNRTHLTWHAGVNFF
jgi:hypothetical protein